MGSTRMSQENKHEYKNLIESVIDWAKKCLEVLRFQKAWQRGQVPEAEMAGRIRTTEEEQKLVEEIFSPTSTFPTKKKSNSGFDIHSIQIEVYGSKKSDANTKKVEVTATEAEAVSAPPTTQENELDLSIEALLPVEAPPSLAPTVDPVNPGKREESIPSSIPPAPTNRIEPKKSVDPIATPLASGPQKPHLLVIDDYEPLLNMLSKSLRAAGYEPVCARDGIEGIVKLHESPIDLIITDVQMPKLDGFDLSKMLNVREETRDIPVIFLTEVLDHHTKAIAKTLGAADTIIKPFTMDTLLESVKTVLASHKAVEMEPASVS